MCGLAGAIFPNRFFNKQELVEKTITHLHKRGPDQSNAIDLKTALLINTRLSIQDRNHGKLPYHEENSPHYLLYNGELYNKKSLREELVCLGYTLLEDSDSEVVYKVLNHFGESGLQKLNGMFALAYYSHDDKEVIIARDRYGVKPLFYSLGNQAFGFSSTPFFLRLLFHSAPDPDFIRDFIQHNYISSYQTPFKDIFQLPPGSYIKTSLENVTTKSIVPTPKLYWTPYTCLNKQVTPDQSHLNEILEESISSQLIGERKIGVYLSSGIDSALICARAKNKINDITAYHIHYSSDGENIFGDELNDTLETAKLLEVGLLGLEWVPKETVR